MILEEIVKDLPNSKYMKTIDQNTKDSFYQPGDKVKIKTGKDKGQIAVFVKYSDNHEGWVTLILDGEKIERNINEITKDKNTVDSIPITTKIDAYMNGYDNAIKFAYIPDMSKELMQIWGIGYKDGKLGKKKTTEEIKNLQ